MNPQPPTNHPPPVGLQNRYELLEELPPTAGGRLFRARDLAFGEVVAIKQFGAGCGLPPAERGQLEETVRRLQCLPHPHLVRFDSLDGATGVLVHEWVEGISLLDLLRRRRQLPASDALTLLASLPGTLDFLTAAGVPTPRPLLRKLFVHGEDPATADHLSESSVANWPPFTLKLNALSLRELIPASSIEDTAHTFISAAQHPDDPRESDGPRELARLLYELLGGRIRELDARRYSPIGALREAGNAVLQRALFDEPHVDCRTLWQDLLTAEPELQRAAPPRTEVSSRIRTLRIPAPLLSAVQPGVLLQVEPADPKATPLRLVARPRFQIGRSSQHADYLARVQPENEINTALTNRLSRIHTLLEIGPAGLQARDGNGSGPSLNGSTLNGLPLPPDPPTPLTRRSLLWLGDEYALELVQTLSAEPSPLAIANLAAWPGPEPTPSTGPHGALLCLPAYGQFPIRHSAWIFTEAAFGLDPDGRFVWDTRDFSASPAAFHYHCGCFWLENHALETAVSVNGVALERDEIAPLTSGTALRLGPHTYSVHIE